MGICCSCSDSPSFFPSCSTLCTFSLLSSYPQLLESLSENAAHQDAGYFYMGECLGSLHQAYFLEVFLQLQW